MLWKCQIKYKGNEEYSNEIRFSDKPLEIKANNIVSTIIERLSYEYTDPIMSPSLFISPNDGKKYIVPSWQEVHPETTLEDINWIKPIPKVKVDKIKVGDYIIKFDIRRGYFTCNCQGFWRVKDKNIGCKHIQKYKNGIFKK